MVKGAPSTAPVSINDLKQKIDDILAKKKTAKTLNKKDLEKIAKDYSMDELLAFQDSALGDAAMSNDDKIAILGNISSLLKTKKNADTAAATEEVEKKDQEHKKEIETLNEQKKLQEEEAEKLKNDLLGKTAEISTLEENIVKRDQTISEKEQMILDKEQKIEELDKENAKKLDELLEAKKKGTTDEAEIKRLKNDIVDIERRKRALEASIGPMPTYVNTGDGYDKDGKIIKLRTRWISGRLRRTSIKEGRREFEGPGLSFVRNLRTRRRLNKTVKMFNKIGENEQKGLKYFLAKTTLIKGGKIGVGFKKIRNYFSIRNHTQLDIIFEQQKKIFIDDLKDKMNKKGLSDADTKTIKAIEDRLEYYHKKYKRTFVTL